MISMKHASIGALAISALTIAAHRAHAVPTGYHWEAVDNCTNPVTGEFTGMAGLWKTYDLFVDLEPGDVVGAVSMGIGDSGISTDGQFFQTPPPFGSDSVVLNESFAAFSLTAPFDTAVAMNDEPLSFAAAMDWNPAGATGAWFSANQNQVGEPLFVGRFTVSLDALFLGGQVFVTGTGPSGNFGQEIENLPLGVVDIGNIGLAEYPFHDCVPAPGAGVVFAMVGLLAARRRR